MTEKKRNIYHLNGCQVHKIIKDDEGNIEKVLLQFGVFFLPLVGNDVKRLKITKAKLDEPDEILGDEITHYHLDIAGLALTESLEAIHRLRGTADVQWEPFWLENMDIKRELEDVIPEEYLN